MPEHKEFGLPPSSKDIGLELLSLGLMHGVVEQVSSFISSVRKIEGIQKCHLKVGKGAL